MKRQIMISLGMVLLSIQTYSQTYPNNENGLYEDLLTPAYYSAPNNDPIRNEINKYVFFVRKMSFSHPLKSPSGQTPAYATPTKGEFGAGKGPGGTGEHHPAIDMHVGNGEADVLTYAVHDGYVSTYRDVPKLRQYLSITKNVEDSLGTVLGKIVTVYAHIDLDLDEADNLFMDGQYVNQGDTVSRHLYVGTAGGPHLHFEIRYYRIADTGDEVYYNFISNSTLTTPSAGSWSYGYWNPHVGYGYAHPENHLNHSTVGILSNEFEQEIYIYPNPTKGLISLDLLNNHQEMEYAIYHINGQLIKAPKAFFSSSLEINLSSVSPGMYIVHLAEKDSGKKAFIRVIKIAK